MGVNAKHPAHTVTVLFFISMLLYSRQIIIRKFIVKLFIPVCAWPISSWFSKLYILPLLPKLLKNSTVVSYTDIFLYLVFLVVVASNNPRFFYFTKKYGLGLYRRYTE